MRTKTTLLGAAILAAGALSSMAQSNVFSVNIVGYYQAPLHGNGYTLIANQLDSGNNVFSNFFQTLPTGTQVLKWNSGTAAYVLASRVAFGNGWNPAASSTSTLNPGEACFVKLPASSSGVTNTFVGNIAGLTSTNTGTNYTGSYTNNFVTGYNLAGVAVPGSGAINTLGLTNVPNGSQFLKWNPATQGYVLSTKVAFGSGWNPSVPSVSVGEGFFLKAASPFTWTQNFVVN